MSKDRFAYYKRAFLNREGFHSIGMIFASIEKFNEEEHGKGRWDNPEVILTIGDCNRQINFDLTFECGDEDDSAIQNNIEKIDKLYEAIRDFRLAYKIEAQFVLKKAQKRREERDKPKEEK